ncbi:hypothetical protein KDAU_38190 [Dictyobacter aurantiacus]|uniref:Uncharacterized protein n=1 Tax=Dictyobacter aurantiacus TaxID=1936993 RepID=A0A401ZI19_9CHLR|nr:hypothetical protein KDAU_38190 [Dictyobacter aurantiacus]
MGLLVRSDQPPRSHELHNSWERGGAGWAAALPAGGMGVSPKCPFFPLCRRRRHIKNLKFLLTERNKKKWALSATPCSARCQAGT